MDRGTLVGYSLQGRIGHERASNTSHLCDFPTGQELEGKRGFFVFPFFPSNPLH